MTGAKVRIKRDDQWVSLDVDELTYPEMKVFFTETEPQSAVDWAIFLGGWIRDNVGE